MSDLFDKRKSAKLDIGYTNVIPKEEFAHLVFDTCSTIINILRSCCGVGAKYNLVIKPELSNRGSGFGSDDMYDTGSLNELNIYSKDGAHSIDSLEFGNEVQNYIKNAILYVGKSVDLACGDGTTTSMLFVSYFLQKFAYDIIISEDEEKKMVPALYDNTTKYLNDEFDNIIDSYMGKLEGDKITVQDLMKDFEISEEEAIYVVAWIQTYTSSHRNEEFAKAFGNAFSNLPKECARYVKVVHPEMEFDKLITLKLDSNQFEFDGMLLNTEMLNTEFKRGYYKENVKLLNVPFGLPDASVFVTELNKYINTLNYGDTLIIISPDVSKTLAAEWSNINYKTNKVKQEENIPEVIFFNMADHISKFSHISYSSLALTGIMNVSPMENVLEHPIKDSVVDGVTVSYNGSNKIVLDKMFTCEEGSRLHPGNLHPEKYIYFTEIKNFMMIQKDRIEKLHMKDNQERSMIIKALSSMEKVGNSTIISGGTTMEQLANRLVFQDCLAACTSSIDTGFVCNGFSRLPDEQIISTDPHLNRYLTQSTSDVINSIFYMEKYPEVNSKYEFVDILDSEYVTNNKQINKELIESILKTREEVWNHNDEIPIPPIQSVRLFIEMFRRIKEIILPILFVDNVIIPDKMWDTSDK